MNWLRILTIWLAMFFGFFHMAYGVIVPPRPHYIYDVRYYGARGDGTTNDRVAIQRALDAGAGATVFFPEGIYVADSLWVHSGTTVLGSGRGSVLKQPSGHIYPFFSNSDTTSGDDSNIVIDGLMFDGNVAEMPIDYDQVLILLAYDAVILKRVTGGVVRNCFFANVKRDGITFRNSINCRAENNTLWNFGEDAIATSGGDDGGHVIVNNTITGQDSTYRSQSTSPGDIGGGILVKTPRTQVNLNRITGCGTAIDINWEGADSLYGIQVKNNRISGWMGTGIAFLGAHHSEASGNWLWNGHGFGIVCGRKINASPADTAYSNNIELLDNQLWNIRDYPYTTAEPHAIELQWGYNYTVRGGRIDSVEDFGIWSRANGTVIEGVTVRKTGDDAIHISDSSRHVKILNCDIDSAGLSEVTSHGQGIRVLGIPNDSDFMVISENRIRYCYLSGIYLDSVTYSAISKNVIWDNNLFDSSNSSGIVFVGSSANAVNGNVTLNHAYGIRLINNSDNNVVANNICLSARPLGGPFLDTFSIVQDATSLNLLAGNNEDTTGVGRFFISMAGFIGDYNEPDSQIATIGYVGAGGSDSIAKYLSQDFGTGEYVTYVPSLNTFYPWAPDTVKVGSGTVPFAEGFINYIQASDSLESPVLVGTYRTLGIWFWKGRQGTDSLQLGVDTVNQWILACDGQGNCIPLTRDSLLGSTLDSVFKYMDADGGVLSGPNARLLDSTVRDVFLLKADSPRFKITSDSTLEVAGRIVTMIGDTTWGVGTIDFKSHLVFHFLDTTGTDSLVTYQLSDTINGRLGNNWVLTVDSTTSGTTQRLVFEAQSGSGGGGADSSNFSDSTLYVVDARSGGVLVGKWVNEKWEWKNDSAGVQMITAGSSTDDITLVGKFITAIGDTTYKAGETWFNGHLYYTYIDTSTSPDSVRFLEMADTTNGLYNDGYVWTIDSASGKAVWAAPSGGPGGGETDTTGIAGVPNGTVGFGQVADSLGTRKTIKQIHEAHGVTITASGDTANTIGVDTTITGFRKSVAKDGSTPMTADWPTADFDITGIERLEADTVEGTVHIKGGSGAFTGDVDMTGGTDQTLSVDSVLLGGRLVGPNDSTFAKVADGSITGGTAGSGVKLAANTITTANISGESGTGVVATTIDPSFGAVLDIDSVGIDTAVVNTRLKVPTDNNPNMVVEGQVAYDANNEMIVSTDGTNDFAVGKKLEMFARTISDPDQLVDDTLLLLPVEDEVFPFGITIVDCGIKTRTSSTYTVVFTEMTEPTNAGTETTIESVSTAAGTEAEDNGTIDDGSIAAGSIVSAFVTDADDITQVTVWFTYYVNVGN